jgi:hypothetical protein
MIEMDDDAEAGYDYQNSPITEVQAVSFVMWWVSEYGNQNDLWEEVHWAWEVVERRQENFGGIR